MLTMRFVVKIADFQNNQVGFTEPFLYNIHRSFNLSTFLMILTGIKIFQCTLVLHWNWKSQILPLRPNWASLGMNCYGITSLSYPLYTITSPWTISWHHPPMESVWAISFELWWMITHPLCLESNVLFQSNRMALFFSLTS